MWTPVKNKLPAKEGEYLCTIKRVFGNSIEILNFSNDLYKTDEWDFSEFKGKHKRGFYDYDSEYGYIYCDGIIAWKPLPEPYTE